MSRLFKNLLFFCIGVLIAGVVVPAFAASAPFTYAARASSGGAQQVPPEMDILAACQKAAPSYTITNYTTATQSLTDTWVATLGGVSYYHRLNTAVTGTTQYQCREANGTFRATVHKVSWCVGAYPDASGNCATCPSGYSDVNGVCTLPDPCVATAGQTISSGYYDLGTNDEAVIPSTGCDNGCMSSFTGTGTAVSRARVAGVWHYYAEGTFTSGNTSCSTGSASPGATTAPPESTCDSATQYTGQVNGKTVCIKKPTSDTVTTSAPVTNPDGSSSQTETKTNGATGGSTTNTKTTNIDGSTTNITNNYNGGFGNGSGSGGNSNGDGTPFCTKNPTDPSCRAPDEKRWGQGTAIAGAGFGDTTSDLDAAKLALTAKVNEIQTAISAKFTGTSSALSGTLPCGSTTVLGGTFEVCLTDYQSTFDMIGNALLAVAYLLAALLIFM